MTKDERRKAAWMTLLGAMWLGLFPLWQDGSYTRITLAKWYGMLALSGVTVATVVYLLLRRGRKPLVHPVQGIALAYLIWLVLSACFGSFAGAINSKDQLAVLMGAVRYEGLLTQGCYVLLFLLMSLFPARMRIVTNVAAGGLLVYAVIVGLQYAGFNPFGLFPGELNVVTVHEFQGPIGNIDMVSCWLCLVMPVLLFAFVLDRAGLLCLLAGGVGALLLMLMEVQSGVFTLAATVAALVLLMLLRPGCRSRGCMALACVLVMVTVRRLFGLPWHEGTAQILFPYALSFGKFLPLLAAAILLLLAPVWARHPGRAVPWWAVLLLIVLVAAIAAAALMHLALPESSGLWELREVLYGRPQDSFGSERLGIWRMTLEMCRESLFFGTGPDTFWYAMKHHQAVTGQALVQNFDNPHNMLLSVLSGSGVPALLLYLALMGASAWLCLRSSRRDPWCLALLAGLAAYQLQGLFTFSICLTSPMFWVMLGMAVSLSCQQEVFNHDHQL